MLLRQHQKGPCAIAARAPPTCESANPETPAAAATAPCGLSRKELLSLDDDDGHDEEDPLQEQQEPCGAPAQVEEPAEDAEQMSPMQRRIAGLQANPMMQRRLAARIDVHVRLGQRKVTMDVNRYVDGKTLLQQLQTTLVDGLTELERPLVICNGRVLNSDDKLSDALPAGAQRAKLLIVEGPAVAVQSSERFSLAVRSLGGFAVTIRVRGTDQVRVVKKWLLGKEMMGLSDWTLHVVGLPMLQEDHSLNDYGVKTGDVLYWLPASHPEASRRMEQMLIDQGIDPSKVAPKKPPKKLKRGFFDSQPRKRRTSVQKQNQTTGASAEANAPKELSAEAVAECLYSSGPNGTVWQEASKEARLGKPRRKKSSKSKRCQVCDVAVSVVLACIKQCKCNGLFCSKHRLPEAHNCSADFKGKLQSAPSVAPTKVQAI